MELTVEVLGYTWIFWIAMWIAFWLWLGYKVSTYDNEVEEKKCEK